jgi:hypothetical protein
MSDNTVKRTLSLPPTKPFVTASKKLGAPPLPKIPSFRINEKNSIKDCCPSYESTQHAYVWRVIDSTTNSKNTEGVCACGHTIVE